MEILSSGVVATSNAFFTFLIALSYIALFIWVSYSIRQAPGASIMMVALAGILSIALVFSVATGAIRQDRYQLKAKFTERVDIYEFLDTYDVIDRDGSILTLEPIDPSGYMD